MLILIIIFNSVSFPPTNTFIVAPKNSTTLKLLVFTDIHNFQFLGLSLSLELFPPNSVPSDVNFDPLLHPIINSTFHLSEPPIKVQIFEIRSRTSSL